MKVFNRAKYVSCDKTGDNLLETRSGIIDTLHEMEVTIVADMQEMKILRAESAILRAPYKFCIEVSGRASSLAGLDLNGKIGSSIRGLVGGPGGCYQLEDICLEAIKAIKQCGHAFTPGGREELLRTYDRDLRGTCHAHCYSLEEKIESAVTPNLLTDNAFTRKSGA